MIKVAADPFDMMMRQGNLTCRHKYNGPSLATVSVKEDCVYETFIENPRSKLALATS